MSSKDHLMEHLQARVGTYIDEYGHCIEVLPPSRMSCSPSVTASSGVTTLEPAWNPVETYKRNDPRGWGGDPSRGAAMGRNDIKDIPEDYEAPGFTIHVEHILLIEGYDPNGTYFGSGGPLFWVYALEIGCTRPDGSVDHDEPACIDYVERFVDLEDAVRIVQETWPHARVIGSEAWCDELVEKYFDEECEREREDAELIERLTKEAEEDEDDAT